VQSGQLDVEQDYVGLKRLGPLDGGMTVRRLECLRPGASGQQSTNIAAERLVILDNENAVRPGCRPH
jgi:hypothetical protein